MKTKQIDASSPVLKYASDVNLGAAMTIANFAGCPPYNAALISIECLIAMLHRIDPVATRDYIHASLDLFNDGGADPAKMATDKEKQRQALLTLQAVIERDEMAASGGALS